MLFAQVLGPAFDALPVPVRALHMAQGLHRYRGDVEVDRGAGMLSRFIAAATRLPPAGRGPLCVEIDASLHAERATGYTTVLKLLQIMADKGLVDRDDTDRTHVFAARLSEERTQRQLLQDLLDRAFGGSALKLVMQALSSKKASAEELAQIRQLLDERERGTR